MASTALQLEIVECPAARRREALTLLLRDLPKELLPSHLDRMERLAAVDAISLDGILVALHAEELVGVAWAQTQPGRTGVLWIPEIAVSRGIDQIATRLLSAAVDRFQQQGIVFAQAIVENSALDAMEWLRAAQFSHLTRLSYLTLPAGRVLPDSAERLEYELYSQHNHGRLCDVLLRTYERSFDCPELDHVRSVEDVLTGYRSTGEFDPSRWLILRHEGADVGCLLLADHPELNQYELVYIGLIPEMRGRGLGSETLRFAARLTQGAGRRQLVLAVDGRNTPARALYERAGCFEWDSRSIFVRYFDAA